MSAKKIENKTGDLPKLVYPWLDENGNERVTAEMLLPSGLKSNDVSAKISDDGRSVGVTYKVPGVLFDPDRINEAFFDNTGKLKYPKTTPRLLHVKRPSKRRRENHLIRLCT